MKKVFILLLFLVFSSKGFSQQPCQAYFTYSINPVSTLLNLYDNSYNFDSTQINVNTWLWTVQYGGVSHTYSIQNPIIPLNG